MKFREDIEGWSKIAPQLYVWDYVTNFSNYILPHPNMRALAPNLRFFADHNVIGMFEQGDVGSPIGDFVRLRAWLLAHLMWNPDRDDKALIPRIPRRLLRPGGAASSSVSRFDSRRGRAVGHPASGVI